MASTTNDAWSKGLGDDAGWTRVAADGAYQDSIGRATMQAAVEVVSLLNDPHLPIDSTAHVLDNGCGGGSITRALKAKYPDCIVTATDLAQGMIDSVAALGLPGVKTQIADAVTLDGLQSDAFSHVATSFMIQFTPDMAGTLRAMLRVLKPGGLAVIAIWGEEIDMGVVFDRACKNVLPTYQPKYPVAKGAWQDAAEHERQMKAAGYAHVQVKVMKMGFRYRNTEEFLEYWFEGKNPVPGTLNAHFVAQGGDLAKVKVEAERIAREDFDDSKEMYAETVIGWGWKR